MSIIIGVDNGNSQTKTANVVFPSGTVLHDTYPEFSNEVISYDGKFYTISSKRSRVYKDKTTSRETFILTLFGIAKELEYRGIVSDDVIEIALGVGLPWQNSLNKKNLEKFRNYFLSFGDIIEFSYNKRPIKIRFTDVVVGAQGLAVTLDMTKIFNEYSRVFILDIGGYTLDCILVTKAGVSTEYTISKPMGVIYFMNKVKYRVLETYDQVIEDVHIMDVLYDRPNVLDEGVVEIIREEAQKYPLELVNSFYEDGIDLQTNPVVFVGGGSIMLRDYLSSSEYIKMPFFNDNVRCNALGYETMVKATLERKAKKKS